MILDSTALSSIDSTATIKASSATLDAGSISLLLNASESADNLDASDASSLILQGSLLSSLKKSTTLNLGSHSSIDVYGSGSIQSSTLKQLGIHAAEIRGFNLSGKGVTLSSSGDLILDNSLGGTSPGPASASPNGGVFPNGSLALGGGRILLGENAVALDQFGSVTMKAASGVFADGNGSLATGNQDMPSNLIIDAPLLTTLVKASSYAFASAGSFQLKNSTGAAPDASVAGFAGRLEITAGKGATLNSSILLPSGSLTVETLQGNLALGSSAAAKISVAGVKRSFLGNVQTSDAGSVALTSDAGNVILGVNSIIDLSAQGGSSAGSLMVSAPNGGLTLDNKAVITATGGFSGGRNGSFSLDVKNLSSLASIVPQLFQDGFKEALAFRIRNGNVKVDTAVHAHSVTVSADKGSIDVTGEGSINASGVTGGNIALQAGGSLILESGSSLSVHGDIYDAAGKGGAIFLSAGAENNGQINPNAVLDLRSGSSLDLGVTAAPRGVGIDPATGLAETDQFQGTLHLRAPDHLDANGDLDGIRIKAFDSTIASATRLVGDGDTISSVASLLGINPVQLVLANNLSSTALLQDGMILKSSLSPDAPTYTVDVTNNSDTVDSVAAALGRFAQARPPGIYKDD
ncbi:MAG: LysM peptidoglycan-binding domain-containing protein, partial [bacterium]